MPQKPNNRSAYEQEVTVGAPIQMGKPVKPIPPSNDLSWRLVGCVYLQVPCEFQVIWYWEREIPNETAEFDCSDIGCNECILPKCPANHVPRGHK